MFIKEVEIFDNKRLAIRGIKQLTVEYSEIQQIILGGNGSGKELDDDTLVRIPNGWKRIGDITLNDKVMGETGAFHNVTGVYPQGEKEMFEFKFRDGRTCLAGKEHLWTVKLPFRSLVINSKKYSGRQIVTLSTQELFNIQLNNRHGLKHYYIPLVKHEVTQPNIDLPIDPYLLGVILGDGYITTNSIKIEKPDIQFNEYLANHCDKLGLTYIRKEYIKNTEDQFSNRIEKPTTTFIITKTKGLNPNNLELFSRLTELNLLNKRSYEKHIPDVYLIAGTEQRLELVRGLMDTDGYVSGKEGCHIEFSSSSFELAESMKEILFSLGNMVRTTIKYPKLGRKSYRLNIRAVNPKDLFGVPTKKDKAPFETQYSRTLALGIDEIIPTGIKKKATCISVDNPSKLYVIKDYIVTHNSTLIRELSPLPPEGVDYNKGGYKKIVIEHKSKLYCLTSTFNKPAGEHSFIDLDTSEELNPGSTQSVQRSLVKDIFQFDDELFEVLTDQIKFSNMSPIQRREWLTRISGSNLDYAIELFNKLRKAQRNEDAVIKHFTNRLNKESANIPNQAELEAISREVDDLNDYINFLRNEQTKFITQGELKYIQNEYNRSISTAIELASKLLRTKIVKFSNLTQVEHLQQYLGSLHSEKDAINNNIKRLLESHAEINNVIKDIENTEFSLPKLQESHTRLGQEIIELSNDINLYSLNLSEPNKLLNQLSSISEELIYHFNNMIDNSDGYFEKNKINYTKEKLLGQQSLLENVRVKIGTIEHRLEHVNQINMVNCEKCNHQFKPGISITDIEGMKANLTRLLESKQLLESSIETHKQYLSEVEEYMSHYTWINKRIQALPELQVFWHKLTATNYAKSSTKPCIKLVYETLEEFTKLSRIEELKQEIIQVEKLIETLTKVSNNNYYTVEKLESIEQEIERLKVRLTNIKQEQTTLENLFNTLNKFSNTQQSFINEMNKLVELKNKYFAKSTQVEIEDRIKTATLKIGSLVHRQNEMNAIVNIINDIEQSRKLAMEKHDCLKVLIEEINPTTGLIADYFQKFIHQFAEQINIVLSKIWEHPIELLPCGLDKHGLNYKFPLRINNNDFGPADCSKGSNSQISIVNFAFKIVVMVYLGLEDYPLYLDELAPDLDEKHRVNIVHFVRDFVESHRCSQMFMVSHYETGYGAFTNAQILILDTENLLEIPSSYNNHCTIVRNL